MKTAVLVLVGLVSTVQTVGWVECCCILICKHHNDPCKDECKDPQDAPASECCEKPAPKEPAHDHDQRCSHVEPSSEILAHAADLQGVAPVLDLDQPVILAPIVLADGFDAEPAACPARGSPPLLHLLFGSLLI